MRDPYDTGYGDTIRTPVSGKPPLRDTGKTRRAPYEQMPVHMHTCVCRMEPNGFGRTNPIPNQYPEYPNTRMPPGMTEQPGGITTHLISPGNHTGFPSIHTCYRSFRHRFCVSHYSRHTGGMQTPHFCVFQYKYGRTRSSGTLRTYTCRRVSAKKE